MTPTTWAGRARVPLGHLPTPLEPLDRLSAHLGGPRIWVKRDDCTGLALGGNKTRKLEFLAAEALAGGADTLITAGGLQSNHVRQTAAAASRLGLACHLVLQPYVERDDDAYLGSGNLLLDGLLGAHVHRRPAGADRDELMAELAEALRREGKRPYVIPGGGSNATGGLGYAMAAEELLGQATAAGARVGTVVLASASGGTQGGLIAGLARLGAAGDVEVLGIEVEAPDERLRAKVAAVAAGTAERLGAALPDPAARVVLRGGYAGEGYGIPTPEMADALRLAARLEGLVLDPVYTGKAMAGLVDLVRRGELGSRGDVVFLHTGGAPGLFAYAPIFAPAGGA